jgi:DnaJ-class molecular chaperone
MPEIVEGNKCGYCGGRGVKDFYKCPFCHGSGKVEAKQVKLDEERKPP